MPNGNEKERSGLSASFVTGAIALVFLILGYQVALFVHRAAQEKIVSNHDSPDTVYVVDRALAQQIIGSEPLPEQGPVTVRKNSSHSPGAVRIREQSPGRKVENFRFNPNTVPVEDLQRLGFSEKQALAIDNYRRKGGRFRRREDFAKSFVVADSVYSRLEPWIDIPRLDINKADSTALVSLPGIGPWYASKIISYREALRGYSRVEQLLEIYRFDADKLDAIRDLINCSRPVPYPLWTLSEEDLSRHPYISKAEAHSIVLYRSHNPEVECTLDGLKKAGALSEEHAGLLSHCVIANR